MADFILDDVKELLAKEKGDAKVLERIRRAAERHEVISVYERDYVKELAEKYLRPKEQTTTTTSDVELPEQTAPKMKKPVALSSATKTQSTFVSKSKPRTTKIAFGIGGIILAIILVAGVSVMDIDLPSSTSTSTDSDTPASTSTAATSSSGYLVEIDSKTYDLSDIISISGSSDSSLKEVELSILNEAGKLVWSEDVSIKNNDDYSTLTIAGGPGWENSGEYTLKAKHGNEEINLQFDFEN